jgi:uncharacterized protein YktA (UPF0223 family)
MPETFFGWCPQRLSQALIATVDRSRYHGDKSIRFVHFGKRISLGHGVKNRENFPLDMEWKTERIFPWTWSEKQKEFSRGHWVKNRENFPLDMEWKTERIFPWPQSEKQKEFSRGHGVKNRENFPLDMEWKTERIFPWTRSEKQREFPLDTEWKTENAYSSAQRVYRGNEIEFKHLKHLNINSPPTIV